MSIRMSGFVLALGVVLVYSSSACGQPSTPPVTPPSAPAGDPVLTQLLTQWEKDVGSLQTLVIEFNWTRTDTVANVSKEGLGSLRCMKLPDGSLGAVYKVTRKDNPNVVLEQYICTGTHVYSISPETKTVEVHTLPPRKPGQVLDDGPMPFLTGMAADVARKRYQLSTKEPADNALKPWYTYVEVRPNFPRDQQDFSAARIVIMKRESQNPPIPAGMPRELFWVEPTKKTTTWAITRVQRNVAGSVDRREFAKPNVPADWKFQNVTTTGPAAPPAAPTGQPRVIRNQDR
jgi:TIGR03009 family protein